MSPVWHVYLLRCGDNSLYAGATHDLKKRVAAHNAGKGARYTRSRLPVKLVYSEKLPNKSQALKREFTIKCLTRTQKLALLRKRRRAF